MSGAPANKPSDNNLASIAGRSPSKEIKGWIRNMVLYEDESADYDHTLQFMFRPPSVREQMTAVYEKMRVMGMSHQYHSFSHTENLSVSFEIYVNALMGLKEITKTRERGYKEGGVNDMKLMSEQLELDRRFLEALLLPYEAPDGTIGAEPPPVILCIPGIVTMRARLMNLSILFQECDINGNIKAFAANVTFEEAPLSRITMRDQMSSGSFRTWGF